MCLCKGKVGLSKRKSRQENKFRSMVEFFEADGSSLVGKVPSGLVTPTEDSVFKRYEAAVQGMKTPSAQTILDFKAAVLAQWEALPEDLEVIFVVEDPYSTPQALFKAIRSGELRVFTGGEEFYPGAPLAEVPFKEHPWVNLNDILRAVHDFYGHYLGDNDFSWEGEHGAFLSHSKMFPQDCRGILEAEVLGQASWLMEKGSYISPQPFVEI